MDRLTKLAVYSVRVRDVAEKQNERLDAFGDEESDLFDFIHNTLNEIKEANKDDEGLQQIISVEKLSTDERTIFGIIETGYYGLPGKLYDRKKRKYVHDKTEDEAEMLPFFYLFEIPQGKDEGILILQRTSRYGIRSVVSHVLDGMFEKMHGGDLRLKINTLVTTKDVERVLKNARVTQLRFTKFGLSRNLEDYYQGGHKEKSGRMELIAYAKKGLSFTVGGLLNRVLHGESPKGLIELDEKFDYDTVKVGISERSGTRQVNLSKLLNIRSYHDVTEKLKFKKGRPTFESLKEEALKLLKQTKDEVYGIAG
jgi:hypothetical protein